MAAVFDKSRTKELWDAYFASPSSDRRNELAMQYRPLIRKWAFDMSSKLASGANCTAADLEQEGMIGLMDAIDKFNPARGTTFAAYMPRRVRGAMVDGLREMDHAPRLERLREKQGLVECKTLQPIDTVAERLVKDHPSEQQDTEDFWREMLVGCTKRERLILLMHYKHRMPMREIAENLGLVESRISQIHKALIERTRLRVADAVAA